MRHWMHQSDAKSPPSETRQSKRKRRANKLQAHSGVMKKEKTEVDIGWKRQRSKTTDPKTNA